MVILATLLLFFHFVLNVYNVQEPLPVFSLATLFLTEAMNSQEMTSPQKRIFSLRITVRESWPRIWRLIEVPSTDSFQSLHKFVNRAMGWFDCEQHYFTARDPITDEEMEIGPAEDYTLFKTPRFENTVMLEEYFINVGDSVHYLYDIGDSWEHDIILEKIFSVQPGISYPICVAGERACPPEDCGGIYGYEHFLECIADPQHTEHEDMVAWIKGHFDPDDFDCQHISLKHSQLKSQAIQMKITIKGTNPTIWRRIQILDTVTFQNLNSIIQRLMGWSGNLPHVFIIEEEKVFGRKHTFKGVSQPTYSAEDLVSKHVEWNEKGAYYSFTYKYGSDLNVWEFEIVKEKSVLLRANVTYPLLLDGQLANPPENCGGVSGYNRHLRNLTNDGSETSNQKRRNVNVEYITFDSKDFEPMDFPLHGEEKRVYQLKISLKNSEPLIWRRVLVPECYTFDELHKTLNRAMGWKDCNGYVFIITDETKKYNSKQVIGVQHDENGKYLLTKSSKKETINLLVKSDKRKFDYVYNFNKSWEHEIEIEVILPQKLTKTYPKLVNGERACPPEECRGITEYERILKEKKYNPNVFDPSTIVLAPELIRIFQFRIVFNSIIKRKIWRRVQVFDNISFKEFHKVVNRAIGWKNGHKHIFNVRNPVTTLMERLGDIVPKSMQLRPTRSEEIKLKELFWNEEVKAVYNYDYRHDWTWRHDIILEEIKTYEQGVEYPRCLAGQGACPTEMEKGLTTMFGPIEYLILLDRKHQDYQTMVKIFGEIDDDFFFDPTSVTFT